MPQVRGHHDTGVGLTVIRIGSGKKGSGKTAIATNKEIRLQDGKCPECGTKIDGVGM